LTALRAVVFAYHNMGIAGIRALLDSGFAIPMVLSHEDDPGENRWFGSVAEFCRERAIPVFTPKDVNAPPWPDRIREAKPDLLFSFYYRSMLKKEILGIPPLGAMNLHGSLLPKYRGRAPVNWVLVKGETETGVTLHFMTEKPDAGDIVGQAAVPIAFDDTALTLFGKMEGAASRLLADLLPRIANGEIPRRPNDIALGSYFGGRKAEDGRIDWSRPAVEIYNLVRAVTRPYPGAFTGLAGEKLTVWWAVPLPAEADGVPSPGSIRISGGPSFAMAGGCAAPVSTPRRVVVQAGEGWLQLEEIEWRTRTAKGEAIVDLLAGAANGRLA
jgi:UDP-4-amino-4-deoxy-L-arabinose formyltransferase/UDP-glucuronic acid dehydrogenase (UDP-4-keto-hexauronic acid decarboxylating)